MQKSLAERRILCPTALVTSNRRLAYDFVADRTNDAKFSWMLCIIDAATPESRCHPGGLQVRSTGVIKTLANRFIVRRVPAHSLPQPKT